MRLTVACLLIACLHVAATGHSQDKVSLNLKSVELRKVLLTIEKKTDYRFLFNEALLSGKPRIDIAAADLPVLAVLDQVLANTGISYKVLENKLVVLRESTDQVGLDKLQDIRVSGRVTSPTGEGIPGVSVSVKGSRTGTTTDANGNFSLTVPDDAVLVFSSVGYEAMEMPVGGKSTLNAMLQTSSKTIDQVIVVGYGTQRKIDVTGSVSQIKGEEISKQSSINPLSALQGKVAGVQISNSGAPGASPEIRIRGVGTIYGTASPLFVVDGVWYNDISFLNPNDIENMSILKDASSEAIYGVRAANGVVLITTKKGRSGQAVVNYNGYVGVQHVTNQVDMSNANEYAIMVNELNSINGGTGQVLNPADYGKGTDWYHQILRNALITNHQVSVSGGSDRSTFNFSLGYLHQEGIVETNDYTRYTVRLQNDFQVFKPLKVGYAINGSYSNSNDIPGSIFHQLFAAAPVVPVYYADGSYGDPSDFNLGDGNNFNPQATIDFFNQRSKNYRMTGNVFAELKLARHFTFRTSLGGEFGQSEVRNYNPVYTATLKQRNSISLLNVSRSETRNWIVENTLTYDNKFGDHNLRVLVGQSAQRYKSYNFTGSAQNVPDNSDADLYLTLGSSSGRNVSDGGSLTTSVSYFSRVNYSFRNRYLLNASIRADAYSQFYGGELWGYFPSVGAGWVISDESFMKDQHIFNNLKLRASWGKIGNAVVPINPSVLTVTQGAYLTAIFGGNPNTGASVNSVVPPTINWEKGVGTDVGLEASLLDNKLYIEADFYNKKTEDAIFGIPILSSVGTGSGSIIGNQASFQNQGFEFTALWKSNINSRLSYSIGGNLSTNNNKVLKVTTGANPIYAGGYAATGGALSTRTVLGQPIGQFYGLVVAGVFQTQAEITGSAQPAAKPGDFKYVDQNKDGVIDGKDRMVLGNPNPKLTYGINTNWTYMNFDLTLDFQGVSGVDVYNANLGIRFGNENFSKDFYDNRWHGQGTSNTYPSVNLGGGQNYLPNSFFVEDGSYFRVRNIQLGYTFPKAMSDRWRMNRLRVYVNAQNAFNFFKYKGFSPEISGGAPTEHNIDTNVYPLYATYNFGVNVTF
jgi:TonB-linked SusC/RagA family outer membrane protein